MKNRNSQILQSSAKIIMDSASIESAVEKIAESINETAASEKIVFVGIRTRGVPLAERIANKIKHKRYELGSLDITLYRDDLNDSPDWPEVGETDIPFVIAGKTIILVDDVLFTGRTIRAAINALSDFGRPSSVKLAVLIDRGLRELPIQPDFCGKKIDTTNKDYISVHLKEIDGKDEVVIYAK